MAEIQDGVPWTSGVDDNTTQVAARNAAASARGLGGGGGTLDPAAYIDPDELAAALAGLNLDQYETAAEEAAAIATALSGYATSAAVSSAIAAIPPKGATPTSVKTGDYTASVGETVLVDLSGRGVADAVYTSGSATVTSATAAFTTADVGKVISASTQFVPKGTTVLTRNSATSITMSANALASASAKNLDLPGKATITAPASAPAGSTFTVKKVDWSPATVSVVPASGDDFDGATSATIRFRNVARTFVKGTGTSWTVMGGLSPATGGPGSSTYDRTIPLYLPAEANLMNLRGALTRAKAWAGAPAKIPLCGINGRWCECAICRAPPIRPGRDSHHGSHRLWPDGRICPEDVLPPANARRRSHPSKRG